MQPQSKSKPLKLSHFTSTHSKCCDFPLKDETLLSSYSYRSATIGSTDEARRAGIALASSVIRAIPPKAATNEIGSPGDTLNSMERSKREAAMASGSPAFKRQPPLPSLPNTPGQRDPIVTH